MAFRDGVLGSQNEQFSVIYGHRNGVEPHS